MLGRGATHRGRLVVVGVAASMLSAVAVLAAPSAAAGSTVVPVSTFTVSSTQCAGPALPIPAAVDSLLDVLTGAKDPVGLTSLGLGCTPLPAVLAPLVGTASASAVASPSGSATASAATTGTGLVEELADAESTLAASITLNAPASSVEFSIPYTSTGVSESGNTDPVDAGSSAFVLLTAIGLLPCTDGSRADPPAEGDLDAPSGSVSGTWDISISCPDGSDLAPQTIEVEAYASASTYSKGQAESAAANIQLHDVTATIDS